MMKRSWIIMLLALACWIADRILGLSDPGSQIAWVGALISGIGSAGAGIFGSIAANRRRRQAERLLEQRKDKLKSWRDAELGTNLLDRSDARAAMRRVFEYNREAQKAADTQAIKQGMTDEAKVAQADRLNRNLADTISQISAEGARHKDRVETQYRRESGALDDLKIQNLMDTSGAANMVQGITGAVEGIGNALAQGGILGGLTRGGKIAGGIAPKLKEMAANAEGVNLSIPLAMPWYHGKTWLKDTMSYGR